MTPQTKTNYLMELQTRTYKLSRKAACNKKMIGKELIEDTVVDECCKILTPKNIQRIAREIMKIAESYEDNTEIKRLEESLQEAKKAKEII